MSLLIPAAHAANSTPAPGGADLVSLGMIAVMFLVFYFMIIRPQQKRQKTLDAMLKGLEPGDEISTNAGILGKIRKIDGDYIIVKVADNVDLKFQKAAVLAVLPKGTLKSIE